MVAKSFTAIRLPGDPAASDEASNQHYVDTGLATKVPTSRVVSAGTGLTGGGALSADIALSVAYGATSTTACVGNDARLSNARTPTAHKTTHATGGTDALAPADIGAVPTTRTVSAGTGLSGGGDLSANRTLAISFGITSTTACVGNDARLSDSRTPTAHAASHATAGSDPISPAAIGAAASTHTHSEADITGLVTDLAGKQPLDGDLTAIAALDSATAGALVTDGAGWIRKTYAQLKTALSLTKSDVGLSNVDNTADTAKPVSTAQQTALDGKQPLDADLTTIAGLTATTDNVIQSVAGVWASRTPAQVKTTLALVKGDVGLGNVDNTSDATKNSATATLTNKTLTSPVINSPTGIVKGDVGLGNVDNTSDAAKNSATATLTNKRITKRVGSTTSTATLTYDSDSYDQYNLTAQAAALSIANPSGTPTDAQQLMIRIKDNGTARSITWSGTQWRAVGITLPTTTVASKTLYVGAAWNSADSTWDVLAVGQQG